MMSSDLYKSQFFGVISCKLAEAVNSPHSY